MPKKTRVQHCSSCQNHGIQSVKRGHRCNFLKCVCLLCELLKRAQKVMRHQQRVWRHQKQKLKQENSEQEELKSLLESFGETKCQVCDKCRNHNKLRRKRNHKCEYADCACIYCVLTSKRRDLMKHLQRVKRSGVTSENNPDVVKAKKYLEENRSFDFFADEESGATDDDDEIEEIKIDDESNSEIKPDRASSPLALELPPTKTFNEKKQRLLRYFEDNGDEQEAPTSPIGAPTSPIGAPTSPHKRVSTSPIGAPTSPHKRVSTSPIGAPTSPHKRVSTSPIGAPTSPIGAPTSPDQRASTSPPLEAPTSPAESSLVTPVVSPEPQIVHEQDWRSSPNFFPFCEDQSPPPALSPTNMGEGEETECSDESCDGDRCSSTPLDRLFIVDNSSPPPLIHVEQTRHTSIGAHYQRHLSHSSIAPYPTGDVRGCRSPQRRYTFEKMLPSSQSGPEFSKIYSASGRPSTSQHMGCRGSNTTVTEMAHHSFYQYPSFPTGPSVHFQQLSALHAALYQQSKPNKCCSQRDNFQSCNATRISRRVNFVGQASLQTIQSRLQPVMQQRTWPSHWPAFNLGVSSSANHQRSTAIAHNFVCSASRF